MESTEMDERLAMEILEEEKRNRFAELLKLGFAGICLALGLETPPDYFEPDRKRAGATSEAQGSVDTTPIVSPAQGAAMVRGMLGPPTRRS